MSGNRANAAAIQRRTNSAQNNVAPPGSSRPAQQQQQQPMRGQQQPMRGQQQQQQMQQQQPMQNPKMSVSDAIGLITLRLGRVETFIQKLPPLDQIGAMNSSAETGEIGENMRVVDEAVFTNIVARLDKLEQMPKTVPTSNSKASNKAIDDLNLSVETLKAEMVQVKSLLMSLQSFTMQTNQKLTELIFNEQQNKNDKPDEENADSTEVNGELDEEVDEDEEVEGEVSENVTAENEDSEILAGNVVDLKAFVQSSM